MSVLKNLWALGKTGFVKEEIRTLKQSVRFLIKLFLFLVVVKILYLGLTLIIDLSDTFSIPVVSNDFKFDKYSGIQKFLLSAFLIPILEELTFRLNLKFSKRNFLIMFLGISYSVFKIIFQLDWSNSLLITVILTLLLGLLLKNKILNRLEIFWKENRLIVFYFLLFSFVLLHSTNYDLEFSTLIYIPLLMLPHFFAGLVFSYARLKSGIIMSISLHILNNGLYALPLLFAT
ncbi:CPBP family glutamic-type intramembrane protease [Bizionia arctica]|uniref:CAAX prenyl protease 2/Lysostaphin resistance protein A-like domain-containing protein n=1 Tax=Bizionia arctica TaxID=1495645 RepID=A0A917LP46_9FLAO|nr:CPBP family glutamic-type intramembrane protease [Bizionia arctica]GGG47360.1 hypothetical protein GCM10010976_18460 [Bizionia arctica]